MRGEWRLFAPALAAWGAALWAIGGEGRGMLLASAAGVLGCVSCVLALLAWRVARRGRTAEAGAASARHLFTAPLRYAGMLLAVLVLLGAQVQAGEQGRACPALAEAASRGQQVTVDVRVTAYPKPKRAQHTKWDAAGAGAAEKEYEVRADYSCGALPTPVIVRGLPGEVTEELAPHAKLRVRGTASRVQERQEAFALRPAGSDQARTLAPTSLPERLLGSVMRAAAKARGTLTQQAAGVAEKLPAAVLVPGFAVGETSLIGDELKEQLRSSSLLHLLAVSGANCALIIGACVAVAARLGAGRRTRVVLAALALLGFCLLVGPDISVLRAALMAGVLLLARFGGNKARSLPALGFAMLALLLCDPWQAAQAGFALSVCATAGILLLVPLLTQAVQRTLGWLFAPLPTRTTTTAGQKTAQLLLLPFTVSLAAQLACGPILLLLTPDISGSGVLANLLAAPAASCGTALGLLALLILPVFPWLGMLSLWGSALAANWVTATAQVTNALPFARVPWPGGLPGALLLAAITALAVLACYLWVRRVRLFAGERQDIGPWKRRTNPVASATVLAVSAALAAAGFAGPAIVAPLTVRSSVPTGWFFAACDVGQGDALLLRDPATPETVMLVDTGDNPTALRDCLSLFGVRRIALLLLTHDDRDHVGALAAVAGMTEQALIAPPTSEYTEQPLQHPPELAEGRGNAAGSPAGRETRTGVAARQLERQLRDAGVPYRYGREGMQGTVGALRFRVLAPGAREVPRESNAASVVLLTKQAGVSALLLADTDEQIQDALLARYPALSADILKVAHHGSRDQSAVLPERVRAKIAAVSVGEENGYGHPVPQTLARLRQAGSAVYRTDRIGSFAVFTSPAAGSDTVGSNTAGELRVWAQHPAAG